jgi:hypothetical protein
MSDEERVKEQLIAHLGDNRAILMVGAGSSKFVDYPLWDELIEEMVREFAIPLSEDARRIPRIAQTGWIKDELDKNGRLDDYYNFLDRRFGPPNSGRNCDDFHVALVRLGFCGITTTNFDRVLEDAIIEAFTNENEPSHCEALDMCVPRKYHVFQFMRDLSVPHPPKWVLHIHGYYLNPHNIILTEEDYRVKYGKEPTLDENGNITSITSRELDSLHRRVLYALVATHPVVFLGFSMDDVFFNHILHIVQQDFELGSDPANIAIMDYTTREERERRDSYLRRMGVSPIFYHAPNTVATGGIPDHSGLKKLILEIADSCGIPIVSPGYSELTKRMMIR